MKGSVASAQGHDGSGREGKRVAHSIFQIGNAGTMPKHEVSGQSLVFQHTTLASGERKSVGRGCLFFQIYE